MQIDGKNKELKKARRSSLCRRIQGFLGEAMVRTSLNTCLKRRKLIENEISSVKDKLSNLPDHLLSQILSKLPTRDSVGTSILSKRWRNLWLYVPTLDLDTRDFEDEYEFLDFIDMFLESNKELDIKRFNLSYDADEHDHDAFVWRISEVLKRRVRILTVINYVDLDEAQVRMPLSLYSCASLVELSFYCVVMDAPESKLVSLPCVKTMCLEAVKFDGNGTFEALISGCPVLETLVVITHPDDYLEVVCVRSLSLKSFKLHSQRDEGPDPVFEIDTPRLEYMSISNYYCEKCIIHSIGPSTKVNIDVVPPLFEITKFRDLINGISKVSEMRISADSLEVIHDFSNLESLPHFINLTSLSASLMDSSWEVLVTFLGCCINLQSLYVEFDDSVDIKEIELSPVPRCFRTSLKFVTLETLTGGLQTPITRNVVDYLRQNCSVLEKFVLKVKSFN